MSSICYQSGQGNSRDKTEQALIANRASSAEIDRQLPVGGEIFLTPTGTRRRSRWMKRQISPANDRY